MLMAVFSHLQPHNPLCLIQCVALVGAPVFGQDPFSCHCSKSAAWIESQSVFTLEGNTSAVRVLLGWYSSICSFSSYSGPNAYACTPGEQWFTGVVGLNWKESEALGVSCRIQSTEKKETICAVNLLSYFETLNISRLVLSLVQRHYLDMHWSPTLREGGRRTNVLVRGEACQHLKHKFATTSKLFPLTHFNCRHGHL